MTAIRARFDGKVLIPEEPVDLPRDRVLLIYVESVPAETAEGSQSFLDWAMQNPIDDPALPPDLAHQHDHYLYGSPKREG